MAETVEADQIQFGRPQNENQKHLMKEIVHNFADNAFITNPGNDLAIFPEEDEAFDGKVEFDDEGMPIQKSSKAKFSGKQMDRQAANMDTQNLFTADPSKYAPLLTNADRIDLINNLSQIKLLQISEHFELIPQQEVDLDQFVKIMQTVLRDSELSDRVDFISELVDIFYRIKRDTKQTIQFDDITTYLIDHEIAYDHDKGTSGGYNASNSSGMNMEYVESKTIKDTTPHNNYIEKLHYFPEIDKLVLYE
jgi:hypothetical protein